MLLNIIRWGLSINITWCAFILQIVFNKATEVSKFLVPSWQQWKESKNKVEAKSPTILVGTITRVIRRRPDNKTEISRFLAKTLFVNKIAMKSFLKYLSFGVDFKLNVPRLMDIINIHNISGMRS